MFPPHDAEVSSWSCGARDRQRGATVLHLIAAISRWVVGKVCSSVRVTVSKGFICTTAASSMTFSHGVFHTHIQMHMCAHINTAQAVKQQERSCSSGSRCSRFFFFLKRICFIALLTFMCSMALFSHCSLVPCLLFSLRLNTPLSCVSFQVSR